MPRKADGLEHGRLPPTHAGQERQRQRQRPPSSFPLTPLAAAAAAPLLFLLLCLLMPHPAPAFVVNNVVVGRRSSPNTKPLAGKQQRPLLPPPPPTALAAIRGVESFGSDFTLAPESEAVLVAFLEGEEMKAEVLKQARCTTATFTGKLFQPVPYSPGTPHGMPAAFELFYENPQYAICHVPPPVMFKARIFTPPRLCAVFEIAGVHPEEVERIEAKRKARMPLDQQINQLEDRGVVPADAVVERITGPANDWRGVGRALRDVVIQGFGSDEDDDPELDALVV